MNAAATEHKAELKRQAHRAIATVAEVLGRDPKAPLQIRKQKFESSRSAPPSTINPEPSTT